MASAGPSSLSQGQQRPYSISTNGWSLSSLLAQGERFKAVDRVSALSSPSDLERRIRQFEHDGIPVVIENWHRHKEWAGDMFNAEWLVDHLGDDDFTARNVYNRTDKKLSLKRFIDQCRQQSKDNGTNDELLYGKDAPCPPDWEKWLRGTTLPELLRPEGTNDLFQNLDAEEAVESIMCYLGIRDTFTPAHKDLCASSGHNIMCYTEDGGSSFWFMTESSISSQVEEYFSSKIGKELDWEEHVASVEDFARAPFKVYIVEQKVGDLVLVPPRSCHQVVNSGGLTIKMSWSRMTISNLRTALYYELPLYRRVCRPEQYRIKQILYRALCRYTSELQSPLPNETPDGITESKSSIRDKLKALLPLFDHVLQEEYSKDHALLSRVNEEIRQPPTRAPPPSQLFKDSGLNASPTRMALGQRPIYNHLDQTSHFACDFCGADLFQSFFECSSDCVTADNPVDTNHNSTGSGLLLCPSCYAEGRTCKCGTMEPIQYQSFDILLGARANAAALLKDESIPSLNLEGLIPSAGTFTFQAACELRFRRQGSNKRTRECSYGKDGKFHTVPMHHTVSCSTCHHFQCYRHLLQWGIHSSEVLAEDDHDWHNFHESCTLDKMERSLTQVTNAEKTGGVPEWHGHKLAILAGSFSKCRPLHSNVTAGFYDTLPEHFLVCHAVSESSLTGGDSIVRHMLLDSSLSSEPDIPLEDQDSNDSDYYEPVSRASRKRLSTSKATSQSNKRAKVDRARDRKAPPNPNLADVLNGQKVVRKANIPSTVISSDDAEDTIIKRSTSKSLASRRSKAKQKPAQPPTRVNSRIPSVKLIVNRRESTTVPSIATPSRRGPPGIRKHDVDDDDSDTSSSEADGPPRFVPAKWPSSRKDASKDTKVHPKPPTPAATDNLETLKSEIMSLRKQVDALQRKLEQEHRKTIPKHTDFEPLQAQLASSRHDYGGLKKEFADYRRDTEETVANLKQEIANQNGLLEKQNTELKNEVKALKLCTENLHKNNTQRDSKIEQLMERMTSGTLDVTVARMVQAHSPPSTIPRDEINALVDKNIEKANVIVLKRLKERYGSSLDAADLTSAPEGTERLGCILADMFDRTKTPQLNHRPNYHRYKYPNTKPNYSHYQSYQQQANGPGQQPFPPPGHGPRHNNQYWHQHQQQNRNGPYNRDQYSKPSDNREPASPSKPISAPRFALGSPTQTFNHDLSPYESPERQANNLNRSGPRTPPREVEEGGSNQYGTSQRSSRWEQQTYASSSRTRRDSRRDDYVDQARTPARERSPTLGYPSEDEYDNRDGEVRSLRREDDDDRGDKRREDEDFIPSDHE